jgi:Protein of unknown function (DUF1161)
MLKFAAFFAPLVLACTASYADNCDALREQIDGKIQAAGVARFSVVVVDSDANASGKVVGSCAKGAKKILYTQGAANVGAIAAASPAVKPEASAKKAVAAMLTECKDGTVSVGGSCKK